MHNTSLRIFVRLSLLAALLLPGFSAALQSLDDGEMSGVTGEGMAFAWTDFRMMFDPQSYLEQMGSPTSNTCTGTGDTNGNYNCWRRADLRWFGLNVSAAGTAVGQGLTAGAWNTGWTTTGTEMTQCANAGINGLGCARGGPIQYFAAPDNPYILRVNDSYKGDGSAATAIGNGVVTYQGNNSASNWLASDPNAGSAQTVLEFMAPASQTASAHGNAQDFYRLSFWGEIEAGRGAAGGGLLKSQTMIQGNAAGSVIRYFKFTQTATSPGQVQNFNPVLGCTVNSTTGLCSSTNSAAYNNRTLAIQYDSYLRGDFRFSVAQTVSAQSDAIGVPVEFNSTEGMYFRNADVHVSLGQLFYQALIINTPRNTSTNASITDGNFTLEIPILPNTPAVYNRFYSLTDYATSNPVAPNSYDDGYATSRAAYLYSLPVRGGSTAAYMPARTAAVIANYTVPDLNYAKTHGYAHWGDWSTCGGVGCSVPTANNGLTNAVNGVGRNAWNSSGDGVFFIGATDFNAYAYATGDVDVAAGNAYTSITYYKGTTDKTVDVRTNRVFDNGGDGYQSGSNRPNAIYTTGTFTSCTASSATDFSTCGSGGSYLGSVGGFAKDTTQVNMVPAEQVWMNSTGTALSATNRPVMNVPAGTALNLGDARIENIQLNYFRFTSYGATN